MSGGQSIGASLLISFRIDWFDLFAIQGTLKSLLQHQNSKALILWCATFFMIQLSHPYMTLQTKKIKPLTVSTLPPSICHKVIRSDAMSLVFECCVLSQLFHSPLSPSSRGSFLLAFCHYGGITCVSEVADIALDNLNSSL